MSKIYEKLTKKYFIYDLIKSRKSSFIDFLSLNEYDDPVLLYNWIVYFSLTFYYQT